MSSSTMERDGAFAATAVALLLLVHFALARFAMAPGHEVALRLGVCFAVCAALAGAGWVGVRELLRLGHWQVARTVQIVVVVLVVTTQFLLAAGSAIALLSAAVILSAALPLALYFRRVERSSARAQRHGRPPPVR